MECKALDREAREVGGTKRGRLVVANGLGQPIVAHACAHQIEARKGQGLEIGIHPAIMGLLVLNPHRFLHPCTPGVAP